MQTLIHTFIQCGETDRHTSCTLYGYMYSLLVQWVNFAASFAGRLTCDYNKVSNSRL